MLLIRRSSQLFPQHYASARSDSLEEVLQCTTNLHDDRPSRPPLPSSSCCVWIQHPRHDHPVTWIHALELTIIPGANSRHVWKARPGDILSALPLCHCACTYEQLPGCTSCTVLWQSCKPRTD